MKNNILIILLLFSYSKINAQKLELGKVSVAELEQKEHLKDPSASAAILYEKGSVSFDYSQNEGFIVKTEVEVRIKIYKKEGYDWANKSVRYYVGNSSSKERVFFSDAVTYNLVNGKIEKTKLKNEGEFDEKINQYWGRKKITMPNVKEGSIIEYKYTLKTSNYGTLAKWNFQTSIPVNYSEYTTYVPEYFIYNPNQKGYIFPKTTIDKLSKSITINSKERTGGGFSSGGTTFSQNKIDYIETKTTYIAENFPALKNEDFVNNIDNYTSSISNELAMTKFPNSPIESYSTDWETVVKKIYDDQDFGSELNKTGYFEDDIKALITGLNNQDDKIRAIFNYVKSKIKWNDYYGYSCNDGVKAAYKSKTGNAAEINLMLTAMLRYANISTNPVLISTRSNGISLFPNRTAFNYVIAAVEIDNDLILLDATEKYSEPNILPLRDLNWFGRLIRKEGSSAEVNLIPIIISKEMTSMNAILEKDGRITGEIKNKFTNHRALSFRQRNIIKSEETYLEDLEAQNHNIEINDYVRENDLDSSKPIIENYSYKDTKSVEIIGGKIYVSPFLFLLTTENPFKQEKREYPVDFGYPLQEIYTGNIEIPEEYVVESLPKSIHLVAEGLGAFKYLIENTDNKIQIQVITDINSAIVPPEEYANLKDFFQKMIDKQNEKIVLVKNK